jgi:hypothetical protein
MYTESDLREALEHSASRADALLDDIPTVRPAAGGPRRNGRRTVAAALAVAATIAAGTVGLVAWQGSSDKPDGQVAAPSSPPATTITTVPATDPHVPATLGPIVDKINAKPDRKTYASYNLAYVPGVEEFSQWTGDGPDDPILTVEVVSPDAGLDATRIPRDNPVQIAGTTGYYSNFKLYPVDGSTGPGSDKWLSRWNIAFRKGADWVFAWLQTSVDEAEHTNSLDDRARIVSTFDKYGVTIGKSYSNLPFRTGYVPDDAMVTDVMLQATPGTGRVAASGSGVQFAIGDKRLTVAVQKDARQTYSCPATTSRGESDVADAPPAKAGPGAPDCAPDITRKVGDYTFTAEGDFDGPTLQKVLDTLTPADDLNDPSTFWSLQDALG